MPFTLLDEQAEEVSKKTQRPKGFQIVDEEEEEIVQQPVAQKGFQLLPDEMQPPEEEPGFLVKSYRKLRDFRKQNEPGSQELKKKEDYQPPKPTDDPRQASMMLLSKLPQGFPESIREDMLNDLGELTKNNKLFTEEGVEKLSPYVGEEYAKQVLLEGLPTGKEYKRDIGYIQAIREGQQESAMGILTGGGVGDYETLMARAESEIPFLKRQAKNLSKIIGDMPAFLAGGAAASLPAGGPETPVGAILAGSGAFATQELIENAYNEALRLIYEHPELEGKSLETLAKLATDPEALKNIGLSTIEGGALGALVALNPLMKVLEKTPLAKMFKVPIAKSVAAGASEVATITTVPQVLRGKIPTAEDFLDNAFLIGGMKVSGAGAKKLANWAKKGKHVAEDVGSLLGEKITQKDELRLAEAKTDEAYGKILDEIAARDVEKTLEGRETLEEAQPAREVKDVEPSKEVKEGKEQVSEPKPKRLEVSSREEAKSKGEEKLPLKDQPILKKPTEEIVKRNTGESLNKKNIEKYINEIEEYKKIKEKFLENIEVGKYPGTNKNAVIKEIERLNKRIEQLKNITPSKDGMFKIPSPEWYQRTGLQQPEQARLEPKMGTETKVPQKREIMNVFKDAFKDTPIRIGKYRSKTKKGVIRGFFSPSDNMIRLKEPNMIETAAHEVGHKLHYAMFSDSEAPLLAQRMQVQEALRPYMDELKPISRYAPHDLEGFAEFTRMYVTRPESAQELAPAFYNHFETELKKKAPDVLKGLLQARDMYDRYLKADPVARTYSHIVSSYDRTLWDKTGDWFKKTFNLDRMKYNWLDESFYIKKAVAETLGVDPVKVENWKSPLNAYIQARVLKGWAGKAEAMLFHETFDFNTLENNGMSFRDILKPIKTVGERQELSAYLVAKRAQLLNKRGIESGIDMKTVNETVNRLKPKYDRIAGQLNAYQDRVLRYAVESGLFSESQYKKMKDANPFYVPYYRFFEEGEKRIGKRTGGETDKLQARPSIKRIFGSTREIIDPLESIVSNTFTMVQNAEKNRFGQTLSKLTQVNPRGGKYMEKVPPKMAKLFELQKEEILDEIKKEARRKDPFSSITNSDQMAAEMVADFIPESIERWRPEAWGPTENVVTVYFDGKPKYYETIPEIADLYKRGGMGRSFAPAFTKTLSLPARALRAGAILNPRFIQKNAIRDLLGGFIYTKHADNAIMDAVYTPLSGLAHAIKKDKLYVDWLKAGGGMATMQSIDKNVLSIKKNLANKVKPITWMRRIGEVSEEMNRLGEYAKAVENMGTDRWQKETAAFQSRDLSIDFAKYGYYAKAVNQIIPFWNATIQGGDKLIRTLASKDPQVLQNFLTRVTAGIVLPSIALEIANSEDPDIQELDEATKDTNWLFKDPVSGEIIQIPVPFETGVLFHGLTRRLYQDLVKKDPHAFDGFLGSIKDAALPGFVPAAVQPFLETWANKDFFRNRHIVHPSQVGLVSEEQYSPFTSHTSRYIARAMSYMPGIDELDSHLTSPSIVDHFIKTWGAGLGHMVLGIADDALESIGLEPEAKKPEERAIRRYGLDAFTKRYPQAKTKSVENFYDTYQKWNKLDKSVQSKLKKGDMQGAKRLQKEQAKIAPNGIKQMQKTMRKTQDAINAIYRNPKMDEKEKRVMIDKLYMREIQQARSFMHQIDRYQDRNKLKK